MSVFQDGILQKWVWIELTGFDAEREDLGVPSFIERAGFVPDGFSLLLYWVGFPLDHENMTIERPLAICEDSYGGHEYCPERRRQNWTNFQLCELIQRLRALGSKVYLSFFNLYTYTDDEGNHIEHEYFKNKPYLLETGRDGKPWGGLHVLKRLDDGTYFSDYLQEKTIRVLVDYGFDGIQIADGISSPRIPLQEGDYSDDMIEQFCGHTGIFIPEREDRAEYIWRVKRNEWIRFHAKRWGNFYNAFMRRLRAADKEAVFNSAWTRDPLEAMYRYGVDYRKVMESGIQGCMVEDVSAGLAILSNHDNGYLMNDAQRRRIHYEFLSTLMQNRAAMPNARITPLAGIHDTMEQWGVLEHMPTSMTRNVMSNLNTFVYTKEGLKPITDGPFFCLSDSLKASDWEFIRSNWEIGYTADPLRVAGATLIWSDAKLDAELDAFIQSRRTPTGRFLSELLYQCAPVSAIARVEDLDILDGSILVTNPDLLTDEERERIFAYTGGPIFAISSESTLPRDFMPIVIENNNFGDTWFAVKGYTPNECQMIENSASFDFDPKCSMDPNKAQWTHPLTFAPISEKFFEHCADAISIISNAPELVDKFDDGARKRVCKMICVYTAENKCRVFLSNDDYYYNLPTLDMKREIASIKCLTKYEGYKVNYNGSRFTARVPGRGMEAFDIELT